MGEQQSLRILYLYPDEMNLYGDRGNVLALRRRAEWRGFAVEVIARGIAQPLNWDLVDLVFMGGGEDSHQARIVDDFLALGESLLPRLEAGLPMLAICGAYQLLGQSYQTAEGQVLPGLGFFDAWTEAGRERAIGDVVSETTLTGAPKTVVGFENHGGLTYLGSSATPLGRVLLGRGNNGKDGTEGAVKRHVIGTYLHGSLLPKNPHLTDLLLNWALSYRGRDEELAPVDETLEWAAHRVIVARAKRERADDLRKK
ncbi:MAG: glutamine amidotransferase [Firmicutes bacterium]|nr:glutamine amidotransferase [Bacillota bacterium]